jgi:cytochrome P450
VSTPIIDEAAKLFATPKAYADERKLHAALTHLRTNAPVSWVDVPTYEPFWAITKHADIMDIERANDVFTNYPRPVLVTAENDERQAAVGVRTLIHMDDPQHRVVRAIGADWFRPKAMRALKERADELATVYVDKMAAIGPDCDFVQDVAVNYPLYMIMSLLGVPESDFPLMLRLTQELFGSDDDEFKRGVDGDDQMSALLEVTAVERFREWGFHFIDCQVETEHLSRFGAEHWPRRRFLTALAQALKEPTRRGPWT